MIFVVILSLATYRATRLIIRDDIFQPVRERIWDRYPPETNKFGYLFTCEWCTSIWLGSLFVLWSIISPEVFELVALGLSASAVAGLLTAYEDK
jgi:hypothetical protein